MADETLYDDSHSLDEIVFKNRNKEYGAYDLRSTYRKILTKSFLLGTLIFLVLALTPFVYLKIQQMNAKAKQEVDAKLLDLKIDDKILEQPKEEEPPPPPPPPKEEPKVEVIQNVVPEPKKAPKVETPPPPIDDQLKTNTGLENVEGERKPTHIPDPPKQPVTGSGVTMEKKDPIDKDKIYPDVDQSAEYPGGLGALRKYLGDNFDTSIFEGGEGKLTAELKFVVERDGTVSDVRVIKKSGNSDFDSESSRVVKKLKKWAPAKKNGEAVRSYYSVPFTMMFE